MGTDTSTPQPVPELMIASARGRRSAGSRCWTASANGGKTSPDDAPATTIPAASAAPLCAEATIAIPATASAPPATTSRRAPTRAARSPELAVARRYAANEPLPITPRVALSRSSAARRSGSISP